jgi:hypothetical protein
MPPDFFAEPGAALIDIASITSKRPCFGLLLVELKTFEGGGLFRVSGVGPSRLTHALAVSSSRK